MIVFYARCSTIEQNEARQLEDARTCHAEKIFIDKASGKDTNRKQLKAMLSFVRECYSNLNHTSAAYTTPPATGVLPLCTRLRRVRRNNPPWRNL